MSLTGTKWDIRGRQGYETDGVLRGGAEDTANEEGVGKISKAGFIGQTMFFKRCADKSP